MPVALTLRAAPSVPVYLDTPGMDSTVQVRVDKPIEGLHERTEYVAEP